MRKSQFFAIACLALVLCLVGVCKTQAAQFKHYEDVGEFCFNSDDGTFVLHGDNETFYGQITPGTKLTELKAFGSLGASRQMLSFKDLKQYSGKRISFKGDFKVIGSAPTEKYRAMWLTIYEVPRKIARSIVLPDF